MAWLWDWMAGLGRIGRTVVLCVLLLDVVWVGVILANAVANLVQGDGSSVYWVAIAVFLAIFASLLFTTWHVIRSLLPGDGPCTHDVWPLRGLVLTVVVIILAALALVIALTSAPGGAPAWIVVLVMLVSASSVLATVHLLAARREPR